MWITFAVAGCVRRAVEVFGAEQVLLRPDCGFATFAGNLIVDARDRLRR
ncbi:MAG: hypothetical protein AB7W59_18805 [Acidimicrobiia bacterium]